MSEITKAVFLSYASEDAEAAKRICEALRVAGVEVWFDQSELRGGDAWDANIRKQIRECALFAPAVSAKTQARLEGYFRLEWRLADQRTHLMAKGRPFLLPVVIDDTRDQDAQVPDSFTEVQWTRLPRGEAAEKFSERVLKLLGGSEYAAVASRPDVLEASRHNAAPAARVASRPLLIGLVAVAVAVVATWFVRHEAAGPRIPDSKPAAAFTEAQKLVQQAQKIYENSDELDRKTLVLADDLVERALAVMWR